MEGEAKGQVGGMDANKEARRDWAVKSRKWRCESCGKTNEEVLSEWREVCREKGVEFEDGENGAPSSSQRDVVPDELRLGYRDELGKASEKDENGDSNGQGEKDTSQTASTAEVSTSTSSQPSTETNLQDPSSTQTNSLPSAQTSHAHTPRATSSSSSPAPPRDASSAAQPSTPAPTPTTTTQAAPSTSSDGVWIDRAIIGLVLALIFMVTRKVVLTDDD